MDHKSFLELLSATEKLTEPQKLVLQETLSASGDGQASISAIEQGVSAERICPHCQASGAVANGRNKGLQRYRCKACKKTFNALTGTPLSRLRHRERWLSFGVSLSEGESVVASAARCQVATTTAFRWRHRFLTAIKSAPSKLKGIVEADETFVLSSCKGVRNLDRKSRKRGGKAAKRGLSDEQVPVLVATDRSGATFSAVLSAVTTETIRAALEHRIEQDALLVTDAKNVYPPAARALGVSHRPLNQSAGERVCGELHINTVNNRHSRFKDFLRDRRGVATRYLSNYLNWFHLAILNPDPTPRHCLTAAMGT